MTMPLPQPQQQQSNQFPRYAERVAAIGVAAAWQRRARARKSEYAAILPSNDLLNDPQYPQSWAEYVGQPEAKARIRDQIARAREREEVVRHMLIADTEPGVGKTALAVLVAREIDARCFTVSGTPTKAEVQQLLASMRDGDILFVDEIHRLVQGGKGKAEWLLHLLQDNVVMGPTGIVKHLHVTVIGATTDASRLPPTILDRFGPAIQMVRYTENEAGLIAVKHAQRTFPPLDLPHVEDFELFIYAADLNPRRIKQLLDLAVDAHYGPNGAEDYDPLLVLKRAGMTPDGLDRTAQRYLVVLRQAIGPIGEAQIRNLLNEASLSYTERRLAEKGYITFTRGGRTLTSVGVERADALVEDGVTL